MELRFAPERRPTPAKWLVAAVALAAALAGVPAAGGRTKDDSQGFVPIFDGKSLAGWEGDRRFWRVEDGAITGQTTPQNPAHGNTFIIWRGGTVADFELKLEFRIFGGNSGIQYRSFQNPKWGKWVVGGYQADLDAANVWTGALYGERFRGLLAARGEKTVIGNDHKRHVAGTVGDRKRLLTAVKRGDWNEYHIIAVGYHFVHKINGRTMIEVTDEDKQMRRASGILALQLHAGPPMKVQFRNIRLKRLNGSGRSAAGGPGPGGSQLAASVAGSVAGRHGSAPDKKKIVFLAGRPSHSRGAHEHNAGCQLLARLLNRYVPQVQAVVYRNQWPQERHTVDGAAAIVVFCDGGRGHLLMPHLREVDKLMKRGVGLACLHYAVEVPKGKPGQYFLDWIGGYFEPYWSVNPHWTPEFKQLPEHPITRGVKPFAIRDEWYYHMRFQPDMAGVTPILSAVAPASTLSRPDGPHSGNPHVRAAVARGEPQHVAWAYQRPDGGRGFGFTGGHFHRNWANDNFRKLVLNAVLWIAKVEVPRNGVETPTPTEQEMEANLD